MLFLSFFLSGAILASPTDSNLRQTMQNLAKSNSNAIKPVYTGISSTYAKGQFFTIDGKQVYFFFEIIYLIVLNVNKV